MRSALFVAGGLVCAWLLWPVGAGSPRAPASEDEAPQGDVTLIGAASPGAIGAPCAVVAPPSDPSQDPFEGAPIRRVRGRVVSDHGEPLKDVWLDLSATGLVTPDQGRTGPSGRFAFRTRVNEIVRIRVRPPRPYRRRTVEVPARATTTEIALERGITVRVRVLTSKDEPVHGAWVQLHEEPWSPAGRAQTDGDGRVVLDGVAPGSACIIAVAARYATPRCPDETVRIGQQRDVTVRLPPPTFIDGVVLSPGGKPIAGTLTATGRDGREDQASSDAKTGRFWIGPLVGGTYRVVAKASRRHGVSPVHVVASPTQGLKIEVPDDVTLVCNARLPRGGSLELARWCTADRVVDLEVDEERPAGPWRIVDVVGDLEGRLYVRDVDGRYTLLSSRRPGDVPRSIMPRHGAAILGTVKVADDNAEVVFRIGSVVIPGDTDTAGQTFRIPGVPPGAEGKLQVIGNDGDVLLEQPARAGLRDVHLRVPKKNEVPKKPAGPEEDE